MNNDKIEGINLLSLLKICKEAVNQFKNISKDEISDHPYIKMKTEQHSLRGTRIDSLRSNESSILAQADDSNDNIQITGSTDTTYRGFRP